MKHKGFFRTLVITFEQTPPFELIQNGAKAYLKRYLNSPKKLIKKFDFTILVPQVELFLFVFGRIEDTKKTFRN